MFDLLKELKKYTPYDEQEALYKQEIIKFLKNNNNCFDRSNLQGHITAGGLVCDKQGNILLNHHKKSNMWFQFGGHSDGDKNSLRVARREIFEESGIKDIKLGINGIFNIDIQRIQFNEKKNEPEHFHYDINFLFIVNNHNSTISNESIEIKWVTIDEAKKLVDKHDYGTLKMIDKYSNYILNK